ncbi:hypothetical protein [Cellulomonas endophytica]|nr:hypothetical protein [Cellulomonas endophytica]
MASIGKLLKSGVALQAARIIQREMAKPQNQAKAKQLLGRVTKRGR